MELDDRQKETVALQVDHIVELLSKRYGVQPAEVIEAVRFYHEQKRRGEAFRHASALSLIGLVASALALAIWEGVKAAIWKH